MTVITNEMSLSQALAALGWTHKEHTKTNHQGRDVFKPDGAHVGVLDAAACWNLLRNMNLIS